MCFSDLWTGGEAADFEKFQPDLKKSERAEKYINQPEKLIRLIINYYYYYYSQGTSLEFSSTHAQALFFPHPVPRSLYFTAGKIQ